PEFEEIPEALILHLRRRLQTPERIRITTIPDTSLYRYHQAIRDFMGVAPYSQGGEAVADEAIRAAARTMNQPADLISAALEELEGIPPARIKQFADESRSLEAGDITRYDKPYQFTLLACMLHVAKIRTRDNLVTMFIKRLRLMHKHAQEALQAMREQQRQIAE